VPRSTIDRLDGALYAASNTLSNLEIIPQDTLAKLNGAILALSNAAISVSVSSLSTTNATSADTIADFRLAARNIAKMADAWTSAGTNTSAIAQQVQVHDQKWFELIYGVSKTYIFPGLITLFLAWKGKKLYDGKVIETHTKKQLRKSDD